VVINDFNIDGVVAFEPETHAPLAVDAYAPLALAVARQLFQLVGWRQAQILDTRGGVKLTQTHGRTFQDFCRQASRLAGCKEMLGFRVGDGLNRTTTLNNMFMSVKGVIGRT
jgi:hypothetical protein